MRPARSALIVAGVVVVGAFAAGAAAQTTDPAPAPPAPGTTPEAPAAPPTPGTTPEAPAAPPAPTPDVPWASAAATTPALPSFLDTTDRRMRDERPPPTAEQVTGLREIEQELDRFTGAGSTYRETVVSLVRREYMQRRRAREQGFDRQIREEETLQNQARENAIRLFERFVADYPDDPTYTPDAMFRLGELYFERSALEFQEQYETAQRDGTQPARDTPDYSPTIELFRQLVRTFTDYRRIDGVYYLIGYCLNEMGEAAEARLAWLSLVCHNHFAYTGETAAPPPEPADATGEPTDPADAHPALALGVEPAPPTPTTFTDPYVQCEPVRPDAQFISETWFRIGEHHFDDFGDPQSLDLAIASYGRILLMPDDRNYNLALYKVAWAYYRASRYPEAIRHFGMLVQWSDDEEERTGRAGSQLRPEAVQYLGIAFAYDDWNENQVPDPQEGMPTGILRIQDAQLLPQDREWTAEVYYNLGNVYFEEAKYADAIAVWELALQKWPNSAQAPELTNNIARAHTRANEMEAAIRARARLGDYGPGTAWEQANLENPAELRRARELAENAVVSTALHYHQQAQQLRRRCVEERAPDLCQQSQQYYGLAATAYQEYLNRYPNDPQAYELRYNLADAYYWSENYEQAAREYALVRDSNLDDGHLSESARLVVEALKRVVEAQQQQGQLSVRDAAPEPEGTPPAVRPLAMPEMVQRLAQARELYLARVSDAQDTENVREAYDYNNSLLLYFYGYWPQARERFQRIFDERCTGPLADETGRVAWLNLRNIAVKLNQTEEVERLGHVLNERQCTFAAGGERRTVDCARPENREEPQCLAGADLTNIRYRRAVDIFDQAERAQGDAQRQLYEQAATLLVQAVNEEPNHPQAPLALEKAAIALERTSRFQSAARLYQRIVDEVGPRRPANDAERQSLDAILANAYFRLAFNANRFFDYSRALENYRLLADSDRFSGSASPDIRSKREDALINAAIILENLQDYTRAASYYQRAAESLQDPEAKRNASYRLAEMSFKQRNWNRTISAMQEFIGRYGRDGGAGELVVQAYWRIAQSRAQMNQGRQYQQALQEVVSAFARSGQAAGSMAAEYAAHARFILVDTGIDEFEGTLRINPGSQASLKQYVEVLKQQVESGARQAGQRAEAYTPVPEYRRPAWTIGSFVQQGRIYELLAKAVLGAPFTMPTDLQRQVRTLNQEQREEIRIQVEDQIRQVLDAQVRPIECLAVARYALAARAARAGSMDNEYTRTAIDRLQAYGDERIAECIAQAQAQDASFGAYQAGEFSRAPRGQTAEITAGTAPPALAAGEE